ncbi:DUF2878 domain-containing protein [Serratia odorifera]|uniref:DUF2878 domain-containing protein n=2 Tax=Serratia odorifera TaxID=618 RepID=D4E938_SEROD|nr:DUF2878 domain-containing protein [Serratia odorifera]EFE93804.1 hypothetical protein HMPREF0758_4688 [Serratia odorifera DSM 4582]PNK88592.1 DUF2878 domain-containing protein [Serratia odorifera]RII69613.1 DUF2878 domain-containing protein [Serratia odorifera]VDZ65445.1 Protein of uncharacterised function (DUF2878) [Serratia odorifera]
MRLHAGFWLATLGLGAYWALAVLSRDTTVALLLAGAALSLMFTAAPRRKWVLLATLGGIAMDAVWCYTGVLKFSGHGSVPLWMMALWLTFSCWWCWLLSLVRSASWPVAVFGAVFGPLSALISWKLTAITPLMAPELMLLVLAIGWAIYLPAVSWPQMRQSTAR